MKIINTDSKTLSLVFHKENYSRKIIYKCLYWYTDRYDMDISEKNQSYEVVMTLNSGEEIDVPFLIQKLKQDIADYKLREIVYEETKNIKELIMAKAFSNFSWENEDSETSSFGSLPNN